MYLSSANWSAHHDWMSGFRKSNHDELPDTVRTQTAERWREEQTHTHTHEAHTGPAPAVIVVAVLVLDVDSKSSRFIVDVITPVALVE